MTGLDAVVAVHWEEFVLRSSEIGVIVAVEVSAGVVGFGDLVVGGVGAWVAACVHQGYWRTHRRYLEAVQKRCVSDDNVFLLLWLANS